MKEQPGEWQVGTGRGPARPARARMDLGPEPAPSEMLRWWLGSAVVMAVLTVLVL